MQQEILEELKKNNRLLGALLAISVDQHLRATDLAKPRPRSIDRMLADTGLNGVEISKLLGKTRQAVSAALASDQKPTTKKAKSATDNPEVSSNGD